MKRTISLFGALLALSPVTSLFAGSQISGEIFIAGFAATTQVDFDADLVKFTPAAPGSNNAIVNFVNGDYLGLLGEDVKYFDFSYALPLSAQKVWELSIDANTWFRLEGITSIAEDTGPCCKGVILGGFGTAYLSGFEPTRGTWSFSADENAGGTSFNFSSTLSTVPDGGTTATLLGLVMIALACTSRRRI